jgi:hypothetical protein
MYRWRQVDHAGEPGLGRAAGRLRLQGARCSIGVQELDGTDYDFIGMLDADISLEAD